MKKHPGNWRGGLTASPVRKYLNRIRENDDDDAGRPLVKRPVAWRVKDFADGWIIFQDEAEAWKLHEETGALMQGLYVRDGT